MSLKNLQLLDGSTISTTGGTSVDLLDMGNSFLEARFSIDSGSSLVEQSNLTFRRVMPTADVRGADGYTQDRRIMQIAVPETIDGEVVYHTIEVKVSSDRRAQDSVVEKLLEFGAIGLFDAETQSFWTDGSTA